VEDEHVLSLQLNIVFIRTISSAPEMGEAGFVRHII